LISFHSLKSKFFYETFQTLTAGNTETYSFEVTIDNIAGTITPTGGLNICDGESLTFNATPSGQSYQWLRDGTPIPGADAEQYQAKVEGNYSVIVNYDLACPVTSNEEFLEVTPIPDVSLITYDSDTTICDNDTISFEASGADEYIFHVNNVAVQASNSAVYSPNDRFQVFGRHVVDFQVQVYDRWRNLIYNLEKERIEDILEDEWWDGSSNGRPTQDGNYQYIICYRGTMDYDPGMQVKRGSFLILR
jgi:hypothetical protein